MSNFEDIDFLNLNTGDIPDKATKTDKVTKATKATKAKVTKSTKKTKAKESKEVKEKKVVKKRKIGATKTSAKRLETEVEEQDVELVKVTRKVKGVSKEITIKRKVAPKKKSKSKVKNIDFTKFSFAITGCFLKIVTNYVIWCVDKTNKIVPDVIGFDIGDVHLGITGLKLRENGRPTVTHFCLLSMRSTAAHDFIDKIIDVLLNNPDFSWIGYARHVRIEQQFRLNTRAQVIAGGIRSCLRTAMILNHVEPDVCYVNAELKYGIGPKYSEKCRNDPLRLKELSGSKGKSGRKELGEHDCKTLLEMNGEDKALEFLECFEDYADQLHDVTDSYLIASDYDEKEGSGSKPKKVTKRKPSSRPKAHECEDEPTEKAKPKRAKKSTKTVKKKSDKSKESEIDGE